MTCTTRLRLGGLMTCLFYILNSFKPTSFREQVIEVRMRVIKLVVGGLIFNMISAYAPHVWTRRSKKHFWEELDKVVRGIPHTKKLFLGQCFGRREATSACLATPRGARLFDSRRQLIPKIKNI